METFGLLCNVSTDARIKEAIIRSLTMVTKLTGVLSRSTNSLVIERGLGLFINGLTRIQHEVSDDLRDAVAPIVERISRFSKTTAAIVNRTVILLYKLLFTFPTYDEQVIQSKNILKFLTDNLEKEFDNVVKVYILLGKLKAFASQVDIPTI
jgi:hypothetical protein